MVVRDHLMDPAEVRRSESSLVLTDTFSVGHNPVDVPTTPITLEP